VHRNKRIFNKIKRPTNFPFFKEIYCTQKSVKYTKLQNCSLNQFSTVVTRRVSDRVSTVLGSYKCSSEKQVQRKNTAAVG